MNTSIDALEQLDKIELRNLSPEYLEKLVHIQVALCRHGNIQIKSNNSLIAQLDRDAFDYVDAHDKLEVVRKYNLALLTYLKEERTAQKKLSNINDLQDEKNKQLEDIIDDRNNKADLIPKNAELKDKIRNWVSDPNFARGFCHKDDLL